ncbi:MAG: TonB-dependent receptor plug domain-containing protein, partial [Muribaculaceae bacterium]|nr:TonB-dependent receptor plug domain-containing protein [Muribaculaceae bacterium]
MEKIIKLFIIAMTMVATTASAFATSYQVKGQLVDSLFNEGEPYVTIRIYPGKKNAKPIKVGVTDENGRFAETLTSSGHYNITFTAIGRQETTMGFEVTDANPIADLGRIIIKDSEEMLDEVEVVARKPIIKAEPDKLVYDLSEDPATKSNTIIEMLRKVPMVTVDGDDNIKVNGSGDFKVYVNGRPDPMLSQNAKEVLKAMPASAIKKIEVITEPGAKYDAEGVGGILNLVTETRTSTDGFLANFTAAASNRDATGTVYARAKQGKVTLSANYSNIRQFESSHSNYGEREIFNSTTE